MTPLQSVAVLLTFAAAGGYINHRWLRLPGPIGTTLTSAGFALLLLLGSRMGWFSLDHAATLVKTFDLQGVFLHGVLALMLFAGALFVDAPRLKHWWAPIASLATVGVLISTLATAGVLYGVAHVLGFDLPAIWCLAFGALIAPTDPIGALAIVRKMKAPKDLEMKLVGESLFNDGTGVLFFLVVLGMLTSGADGDWKMDLARELLWAPAGGAAIGLVLGWIATRALSHVDDYPIEVLITLALATGSYGLSEALHASAPIAVVVAGLVIGTRGRSHAMSERTRTHLDTFWETLDELLNAALFALIGLEILTMPLGVRELALGVLAWGSVLAGRWLGVIVPLLPFRSRLRRGTVPILTWGGLRGGISLALALSLPASSYTATLVAATFVVVVLSSVVQGLSLGRLLGYYKAPEKRERVEPPSTSPETGPDSGF